MIDMPSTHDVVTAAIKHHVKMRDAMIDLQGMDCVLRRVVEDSQRADFFGDIAHTLTYQNGTSVKLVIDIPDVVRKVHQMEWASDDWKANPVVAEAKMSVEIDEGDLVLMSRNWFVTNGAGDRILQNSEVVPFQVIRISQFVHYEPISKLVYLVPFLNEIPGVTHVV